MRHTEHLAGDACFCEMLGFPHIAVGVTGCAEAWNFNDSSAFGGRHAS